MPNYAVIPAYNEEEHIQEVIQETKKYLENVIVVDDGSKDNTYHLAKKEKVVVLRHLVNLGKGKTLRTGCDYALKMGAEKIIVLDADAQHDPRRIPDFLEALNAHDIALGYRNLSETMPFVLKFGNWFLNRTMAFLYRLNLRDTQCGYRAFTSEAYQKIRWNASDYSMESEMLTKVGKHKLNYAEVPLQTIYLDEYKGTTILDGMKIALKLLWWRVS